MSNITSTTTGQMGAMLTVVGQKVLDALQSRIVIAKYCAKDTDFAPATRGASVNISMPGIAAAQDKTEGTPISFNAPTADKATVTLNKHKVVTYLIEDYAKFTASLNLVESYASSLSKPLAEAVETDLMGLYTSITQTSGANNTQVSVANIRDAWKQLEDAKVDNQDRYLVVSPKDANAIKGDSALQNYFAFSNPAAFSEGSIGRVEGFDTYTSQLVPKVTGTPNTYKNMAFHKNAFVLATRPLVDNSAPGVESVAVTDDASGLTVRMQMSYSHKDLGWILTADILYGVAVLRANHAVVITSNAA